MQKGSNQSRSPWKSILNEPLQQKKKFTALMPSLSNFIFKCKDHLQIKGCVRGTSCLAAAVAPFFNAFLRRSWMYTTKAFLVFPWYFLELSEISKCHKIFHLLIFVDWLIGSALQLLYNFLLFILKFSIIIFNCFLCTTPISWDSFILSFQIPKL